jgi:iron complex outermembrane receptor protein
MMITKRRTILGATVCGILAAGGAQAQQASTAAGSAPASTGLEEVIVTSRRFEESLQETPIAVSAFQSDDIQALSIVNVGDLAAFTPNFVSNPGPTGGNDAFYFIRGVGQTDLNPATDPGVGTYIDGVYMGRVMGASMDAGDVSRVEVLRGPQGTLFGRNTIGGAVNITTRDPGDTLAARFLLGTGSRDLVHARASVDIPLGENAALLLAAALRDQDGWGERADGEVFDTNESRSGRMKLVWDPTEDLHVSLAGDITSLGGTSQHTILTAVNPALVPNFGNSCVPFGPGYPTAVCSPLLVPMPAGVADYVNTLGGRPYRNQSSIKPDKDYDVKGTSLNVDWKLGFATLRSITAYRDLSQDITTDYDSTPYAYYEGGFVTDQDQVSQEFQLLGQNGRFNWQVGAFYYDEHNEHTNVISLGGNNGCLPPGAPVLGPPPDYWQYPACAPGADYATVGVNRRLINNQAFDLDINSIALFGQTTIEITDEWSATAGLRWTDEEKEQSYDFFLDNTDGVANQAGLPPFAFPTFSPRNPNVGIPTTYKESWSEFTPKLGLEYKPTDGLLYYFSYARGFKSGGFNGRPTPGPGGQFAPVQAYDPEEMDSYELGAKTQFADDRVRLNVAAFYSDYKGIQLLRVGESGFFETVNAAESRIQGLEAELLARPVPQLQLQAALGYTDNEYQELDPGVQAIGIGFDDNLPLTPELTASFGAQYTLPLFDGELALRSDYSYRSEVWYEATNTPINRQGGYGLWNARASWSADTGTWGVSLYGLNLGDKEYYTNVQDVTGALGIAFASVSAPREWGVEVRYNFGK